MNDPQVLTRERIAELAKRAGLDSTDLNTQLFARLVEKEVLKAVADDIIQAMREMSLTIAEVKK